jgi:hypothetical protein
VAEQGVIHSPTFTLPLPLIIRLLLARKTWKLWTSRRRKFPCYPVGGLIGGISKKHIFHLGLAVFNIFFWAISECFGFVKNAQLAKYSETHRPSTSGRSTVSFFQLVADVLSRRQDVKSNQPSLKQLSQSLLGNLIKFIGQWKFP